VHLTRLEYEICTVLARNGGRVITHERLRQSVMGPGGEDATGALRVHILNLRKKLEDVPAEPRVLLTEPGVGYRFMLDQFDGEPVTE
jgi:two-component system KDP operon response regulator KdpE